MSIPPGSKKLLTQLIGAGICALSVAATAQTGAAALERQTDEAFRQVLRQPQDLSGWSRYAQLQVEAGNYEGGIAALERLLLQPQANPDLRVDIAALYYRLGSYAAAEAMLGTALEDSRLHVDKRAFATALLADVRARNQRSQLQGVATLGWRHQSNPTYRSDAAQVLSAGVSVPLPSAQQPAADNDLNAGLRLSHRYDLERQNEATLVSHLGAYLVNYRSSSGRDLVAGDTKPYDLQLIDFNSGLEFKPLPATMGGLTVRPHVVASNVVAKGHQYLRNVGLGLDLTLRTDERTLYEFSVDGVHRDFSNRVDVADAHLQDGHLYSARARVSRELAAGQVLVGEYFVRRVSAQRAQYDFDSHELRASYVLTYRSPLASGTHWTTVLWAGVLHRTYDAADPAVSTIAHKDREWRLGIHQSIPLVPQWSMLLSAEHARNRANLPNYRYKNTSISATVVRSF